MFKTLDKDGSGTLTTSELNSGFDDIGITPPDSLFELIRKLDSDDSGSIDYSEFLKGSEEWTKISMQKELNLASKKYGEGQNGKLSLAELKSCIPDIEGTDWYSWLTSADINGDGFITVEELKAFLSTKLGIELI